MQGRGWVSADDLVAGEILSTPDGQTETVVGTSSVVESNGVQVYNFTVADDHTYFVEGFGSATNADGTTSTTSTLDAAWVHNSCFRQNVLDLLGMKDPGADFQAHHIIPINEPEGAALTDLLDKLDIVINDPVNGAIIDNELHGRIHFFIDDYIQAVEDRIINNSDLNIGDANAVRTELQSIGRELMAGTLDF